MEELLTEKEDATYRWSKEAVHGQERRYGEGPFKSLGWIDIPSLSQKGAKILRKRMLKIDPDTFLIVGAQYLTKI
jgi:hypothetical protein